MLPRLPALLLLLLGCTAMAATTTAFVAVAPAAQRQQRQQGATTMMAQRHYEKFTRGDFLLKSALATGAFVPVVKSLRKEDGAGRGSAVLPAADASPFGKRDEHDDDEQQGDESVAATSFGPPLRFEKDQRAAMQEMREVVDRFGGSMRRQGQDLIRVDFGGSQELELRFTKDGNVHTRVGRDCWDMRRINLLGEELAAKGGWQVKGYPLCLDPAMAKYI